MIVFPLYPFLSIEIYSRFCFVTGQEEGIFSLGGGQVGTRREQNDVSVSVLGQDNWVGFDILWLGKLGPKCDRS